MNVFTVIRGSSAIFFERGVLVNVILTSSKGTPMNLDLFFNDLQKDMFILLNDLVNIKTPCFFQAGTAE